MFSLTSFVRADDKPKSDCVLCGHITDSKSGQAITDAIVEISGGPVSKVEADANGFYCFEKIVKEDNYRIAIDSNEYVGIYNYDEMPVVNLKSDSRVVKDFKLTRACRIKVQVVDEKDRPVENAKISANYLADGRTRKIGSDILRRKTDKEGFCLVGGIAPKTVCQITATHGTRITSRRKDGYGVVQTQWDYAPGHLEVALNDTEVTETGRIVLRKGVDVNGIAKYQDGVPAGDLKIQAYPDWWISYTSPEDYPIDANGCFTLRHIATGTYRILVNIPTGEGSSMGVTVSRTMLPLPDNELLMVTIPQKSPQALASIRGKFIFVGDKVPAYVEIQANTPGYRYGHSTWHSYRRDANDTNFIIDRLEPGKYKLTFSSREIEQKVIEDVNAPCEGLLVELLPREESYLKGTVLNSQDNKPIQKFRVRARKIKTLRGANYQQPDKWLEFNDAEGRFSIDTIGPGIYQVQVAAEDYAWAWSQEINTDDNNPVVINLLKGGGIKGKVINEAGRPIKKAKVLPFSMAGGVKVPGAYLREPFISEEGAVETGNNGVFVIKHLAPGKESIKVIHPDYAYLVVSDIEIKDGQTTEDVNVVMPAGGIAEGYVYDAQGRAQPNVMLYFQDIYNVSSDDKAGRFATVTTDVNGYYRVGGLPEQLLTVKRQKGWDSMGVICRVFVPTLGRVSRIDLGGRPIVSGRIIVNGIPMANRRIVLASPISPKTDIFRCYAMTGPDGKFTFRGVPNGEWQIYCEDTETRGNWIRITKAEVVGQDVNLDVVSVRLSTIYARVKYEPGAQKWDIKYAHLQAGDKPWGVLEKKVIPLTKETDPYIITNLPAGKYYLTLMRQDYVSFRQSIEVNEMDVNVAVRIPKCTSGIRGRLADKFKAGQTIWTRDKSIVGYIKPDADFNFKLDNLPAGHYYVGGNMLIDSAALLGFDLAEGEQKVLDVNIPDDYKNKRNPLYVMAIDENGVPLLGAKARLSGSEGTIEPVIDSSQGIYFTVKQGSYTLQVDCPGYKTRTQQVSVEKLDPKNIQTLRKPVFVRLERQ
jgi:hypothetical protein